MQETTKTKKQINQKFIEIGLAAFEKSLGNIQEQREADALQKKMEKEAKQKRRALFQKQFDTMVELISQLEEKSGVDLFFYNRGVDGRTGKYDEAGEFFVISLKTPKAVNAQTTEIYFYCSNVGGIKPYGAGNARYETIDELFQNVAEYCAVLASEVK